MTDPHSRPTQQGVLYSEKQRVPLTWWFFAAGVVAIISWQAQMQHPWWWAVVASVISGALAMWALLSLSQTTMAVFEDPDGTRWLQAGKAKIPTTMIDRTLVIPPTAKQAAMGRQLDPAAFVVHKAWIPAMAMLVLDDPEDPTPYWLISSKDPDALLHAVNRPIH